MKHTSRSGSAAGTDNKRYTYVNFGIPELDDLFGKMSDADEHGPVARGNESISICLVGADGTGKSVLAMHAASMYAARYAGSVVYFSEDLGLARAETMFDDFCLNNQILRSRMLRHNAPRKLSRVVLQGLSVNQDLPPSHASHSIGFVDLQSDTSGNDWTYLLDTVGSLPRADLTGKPRFRSHALVIVDNVDAFQLVNSGVDSFGETRTRWSHLDQLMRLARGRCHLILISCEPASGRHLDEQYAADYVLHLRVRTGTGAYSAKEMCVEKARGQVNVGGSHAYSIRGGEGTTSGYQQNPDNRYMKDSHGVKHGYIRVFPSLDYLYSREMARPWRGYVQGTGVPVGFAGLDNLKDLLPGGGLKPGTITAVVGPRISGKGNIAASLAAGVVASARPSAARRRGFDNAVKSDLAEYIRAVNVAKRAHHITMEDRALKAQLRYAGYIESARKYDTVNGAPYVIVYVSTEDIDSWRAAFRVAKWLDFLQEIGVDEANADKVKLAPIEARMIYRRLDIHTNSSATLFSCISQCVAEGIRMRLGNEILSCVDLENISPVLRIKCSNIVVVITDWTEIEERYPEVAASTDFLPLLLFYLKRQGVVTLITETRADTNASPSVFHTRSRLAQDADQAVLTWRVPGDSRVAIAVLNQANPNRTLVREVRKVSKPFGPEIISIKTSLERYEGFETGNPTPVKLNVRLVGQTPAQHEYAKLLNSLLDFNS